MCFSKILPANLARSALNTNFIFLPFSDPMEINNEYRIALLETLKGFVHFAENPDDTTSVFELQKGLSHHPISMKCVEFMMSKPEIRQIAEEKYQPQRPSLDVLVKYPEGTLAHAYAKSLLDANFDPNFFEIIEVVGPGTYLDLRVRQTHDIWHVMTGFSTDLAGELGLQAFQLTQIYTPLSVLLMSSGLLHGISIGADLDPLLHAIEEGFKIGKTKIPFVAVKWEEHWDRQVTSLREEFGLRAAQYTRVYE